MLAQPVAITSLDGIPADVRQELRGNGKYDRVKLVEYALANWDKDDPTDFGNSCTNFVSNALLHAGMKEKTSVQGTSDDDSWMAGNPTGVDSVDKRLACSDTWAAAENQQNFMLAHGGTEVPRSENAGAWKLSCGLESFKGMRHTDWNLTVAATVLVMAPVILVFFFAQKAFVEGVTLTGVKG